MHIHSRLIHVLHREGRVAGEVTHRGGAFVVGTVQHQRELQVSFAKEPYKRDDILQKRPII